MGGDSIAPYWVEDIERVRADLDDIEKKSLIWKLINMFSWCFGNNLQRSCFCCV